MLLKNKNLAFVDNTKKYINLHIVLRVCKDTDFRFENFSIS